MDHLQNRDSRLSTEKDELQKSRAKIFKDMIDPDLDHLMPELKKEEKSLSAEIESIVEDRGDVETELQKYEEKTKA
jgi:hypothetical protein